MKIGKAIEATRQGRKVIRKGWNGKGIFVGLKKGFDLEAKAEKSHASWMEQKHKEGVSTRLSEDGEELMVPYSELSEKQKNMDRAYVSLSDPISGDYLYIDTTALQTENQHAPKTRVPWVPSQSDVLANDWQIVE